MWDLTVSDVHTFAVGEGQWVVHNCAAPRGFGAQTPVEQILAAKLGSITRAELPKGSPSWDTIRTMTWADIEAGAKAGLPGYSTIRKLLSDKRFDR